MQADPHADLHLCFKRSYDDILKHQHSFVVRSVVTVSSLGACPSVSSGLMKIMAYGMYRWL